MIPNHVAPKLSELDLAIARAVPPGGNWKNIPESVPSARLAQIRESYARGEGSRSTYYGRLHPERPAYTISTYFARPGNGCHLHFDQSQDRTLSYREAARLQSFPDSFVFGGSNASIAKQIGNAVPPLLAYWLGHSFKRPGALVDLFAGAGGLSLGFHWAGWRSVVASDIDESAMETFARNIHSRVVVGDIRAAEARSEIIRYASDRKLRRGEPLVLVGGPPCQGFSTAGNRRSRDDERNHLFKDYCRLVEEIGPDAFLFENVPGLTNMEGGAVFREVLASLRCVAREVKVWQVPAETYGVPQRRKRIVIVGFRTIPSFELPPGPLSSDLFGGAPVSVVDALGDLPPLRAGEDGARLEYLCSAKTDYQRLMRGVITADQFVERVASGVSRRSQSARAKKIAATRQPLRDLETTDV